MREEPAATAFCVTSWRGLRLAGGVAGGLGLAGEVVVVDGGGGGLHDKRPGV